MKIVIVGGGTAGWLSACYLAKYNKDRKKEIIVIESSKYPIIGAGEGSTGTFAKAILQTLKPLGVKETDFLMKSKSTLKLGIRFKDWNGVGTEYLSPIQPTETSVLSVDTHLLVQHILGDFHNSSPSGYLMDNGYSTFVNRDGGSINGHAYHFDAHNVGEYFKEIAIKNGVKVIDTEVTSLNKNYQTGELDSIETPIGTIKADFWVDCSGFARVLIKPMNGGWESYSEHLLVNNALTFQQDFESGEIPKFETLSQAMKNGWMWKIPTQERYGCGYVYCDKFASKEDILNELESVFGRKIENYRNISFDCGRLERAWVKNVVAIGLSAGFVEPLEATPIHSTLISLDFLNTTARNFRAEKESILVNSIIDSYNDFIGKLMDDVKDLIQSHYVVEREDTEFWKYCKYKLPKTENVKRIMEVCKHRAPSIVDFNYYHGAGNWGVWCWILCGLGHLTKETARKTLESYNNSEEDMKNIKKMIDNRNFLNSVKVMKTREFMKALWNKEFKV